MLLLHFFFTFLFLFISFLYERHRGSCETQRRGACVAECRAGGPWGAVLPDDCRGAMRGAGVASGGDDGRGRARVPSLGNSPLRAMRRSVYADCDVLTVLEHLKFMVWFGRENFTMRGHIDQPTIILFHLCLSNALSLPQHASGRRFYL